MISSSNRNDSSKSVSNNNSNSKSNQVYALIMAGGSGTRFWPESTKKCPKQYLSFGSKKSLLEETLSRIERLVIPSNRYIVTVRDQEKLASSKAALYLEKDNIILEPAPRNTAPCILLSILTLLNRGARPEDIIVVLPADHVIFNHEAFHNTLSNAVQFVSRSPLIATIGVRPHFPHTGYGYIRTESSSIPYDYDHSNITNPIEIFPVAEFKEKPDYATAEKYLRQGFFWNAGMFVAQIGTFLKEMENHSPDIYAYLEEIQASIQEVNEERLSKCYQQIPANSIDYAVMERSSKIALIPAAFDWNDLGSWDALNSLWGKEARTAATDSNLLLENNQHFFFKNAHNNIVKTDSEKLVVMIGVNDLIVISNDKTVMVVPQKDSQTIKEVVNYLQNSPWGKDWL